MKKSMVCLLAAGLLLIMALTGCGGKKVEVKLLPEKAHLGFADGVVVEPDKPPYNLGGWRGDSEPMWKVEIPQAGMYKVSLEYSRPGQTDKAKGIISLDHDKYDSHELNFTVRSTGKNDRDWSVYQIHEIGGAYLEAGTWQLSIKPNWGDAYSGVDYFINLRSVTLKLEKEK
ncbi:hypothetical protein M7775_22005 [Sporomusa sphaeroides DSM 2875]|uniref:hypothetical protein n=1 Tax=Sporomusa sphaeroides TaxID=47679 RepID=UPI002030F982|nr:hypothetical protein [Sporomusa sphaeroides]MCM0761227.1 hypothetical protein [Sporomusa sphaeroides DSM 2875]